MASFAQYVRVKSPQEAYELLQRSPNNRIVAGNVWLHLQNRRLGCAIDLCDCELSDIVETQTAFEIGAMTTLRTLETHKKLNALCGDIFSTALRGVVGTQMRNLATVGGSVWGRFGFSDVLCALMPLDVQVRLVHTGLISLSDFCEMSIREKDVLTHVIINKHDYHANYQCVRKSATDFASLNVCAAFWNQKWHVACGSRPARARLINAEVLGDTPIYDARRAEELAQNVQALRFSDNLWGSQTYRKRLAQNLVKRAYQCASEQKEK